MAETQVDLLQTVRVMFGDLLLQIAELRAVNEMLKAQLQASKPADPPNTL